MTGIAITMMIMFMIVIWGGLAFPAFDDRFHWAVTGSGLHSSHGHFTIPYVDSFLRGPHYREPTALFLS